MLQIVVNFIFVDFFQQHIAQRPSSASSRPGDDAAKRPDAEVALLRINAVQQSKTGIVCSIHDFFVRITLLFYPTPFHYPNFSFINLIFVINISPNKDNIASQYSFSYFQTCAFTRKAHA